MHYYALIVIVSFNLGMLWGWYLRDNISKQIRKD